MTFSPILDAANTIVGVSAISRDITQLVRARQEIAEREERIRLLLDSTAEAIYGIDLSGVCTFCNSACARLLGYDSPAALIGKQMHPLIHHTQAGRHAVPAGAVADLRGDAPSRGQRTSTTKCSGAPTARRSRPSTGAIRSSATTRSSARSSRSSTSPSGGRPKQEIQEGVRRREQFLAMLSHELRNPLAAILSATRVLESAQLERRRVPRRPARSSRARPTTWRACSTTCSTSSRITRGRIVLRTERVDLRDTARSAIEALGPFMAEHDTHLDRRHRRRAAAGHRRSGAPAADPGQPAEQRLEVLAARRARALRAARATATQAMIRVTRHGPRHRAGDAAAHLRSLRPGRPVARRDPRAGSGIGLTLLRSLVELHDGRVEARERRPGPRQHVHRLAAAGAADRGAAPTTAPRAPAAVTYRRARRGSGRRAPHDAAAAGVGGHRACSRPRTAWKAPS